MIQIDVLTTKTMLSNTSSAHLIHKGSFDSIAKILTDKRIISTRFISFSDGIPLIPLHGDSVILFDKDSLIKKNCYFLKIDYTTCFDEKNSDILAHLMENKTEDELLNDVFKGVNFQEKKLKEQLDNIQGQSKTKIYENLKKLSEFKTYVKSHTREYLAGIFALEKEIISISPFNFDLADISYVISNSLLIKYCEIPSEIKNKIFLIDYYYNAEIAINSPLNQYLDEKLIELKQTGDMELDMKMFIAFHIIDAIISNPSWNAYVKTNKPTEKPLPEKWAFILKNVSNISDNELKMELVNYLFRCYTLCEFQKNEMYEDSLYSEILNDIKK